MKSKLSIINYQLSIIFAIVLFYACDPGYHLLIGNRSGQAKEIQVKAFTRAVDFYELGDDIFNPERFLRSDTLPVTDQFVPLLLPNRQTIKIQGSGIAQPKGEAIIVGRDTIDAYNFTLKKTVTGDYKWGYVIEK